MCGLGDLLFKLDNSRERFGIVHLLSFVAILVVLVLVGVSWIVRRILLGHTLKDVRACFVVCNRFIKRVPKITWLISGLGVVIISL